MKAPHKLYKYESISTRSLANLKNHVLYFGSPLNFNDPYDCAIVPNIATPSNGEVESIRAKYLQQSNITERARFEFSNYDTTKLCKILMQAARDAVKAAVDGFLKKNGVTCFSEKNDDLLMWSHYGGQYKGFCLEFSTRGEPFSKVRKVQYVPKLPRLKVGDILFSDTFDEVWSLFCTKSKVWAYEKEWRAVHHHAGTSFVYRPETLTGIYFGPDIDREFLEIICLVLGGQNEHVKFWQGERSTTEFKVLFKEFNYLSNIEARKKGYLKDVASG